jgi:hypothetical protein
MSELLVGPLNAGHVGDTGVRRDGFRFPPISPKLII